MQPFLQFVHTRVSNEVPGCPNSVHKTCPLKDRAQNAVIHSAVYDSVMLQIVFLHLECNGNAIRRFQIVGLCGHEKSIFEEGLLRKILKLLTLSWDLLKGNVS